MQRVLSRVSSLHNRTLGGGYGERCVWYLDGAIGHQSTWRCEAIDGVYRAIAMCMGGAAAHKGVGVHHADAVDRMAVDKEGAAGKVYTHHQHHQRTQYPLFLSHTAAKITKKKLFNKATLVLPRSKYAH